MTKIPGGKDFPVFHSVDSQLMHDFLKENNLIFSAEIIYKQKPLDDRVARAKFLGLKSKVSPEGLFYLLKKIFWNYGQKKPGGST
jgi:hypothetical protein